jgi:glycosyltransferase involved in cell wall biosynthesis
VTVLTCQYPGQPKEETFDGIRIQRSGLSRNPYTGGPRKAFLPVVSYILRTVENAIRSRYDVIHCNTYFPVYAGAFAGKLKSEVLVCTFHDSYGLKDWIDSQRSIGWGLLGHFASILAAKLSYDHVIAVSPQCKQKLLSLGLSDEKITIIQNGVDLKLFDSINIEKVPNQVLYVGRLVSYKHVDWLISAFAKVLERVPDARLKIVGSGPELPNLYGLVRNLGLQSCIVFAGRTPTYEAVAHYFKESEVFVLPSTMEGEGIVLKEAMAASVPLIAMNVLGSGVLSVVRDGENGFLINPEQPALIAERIVELLENAKKRKKMGEAGRKFVEEYDWEAITTRTIAVYEEALS